MIINEVDVKSLAVFEPKNNAPIRAHCERPKSFEIALQRMQSQGRQIQIAYALRCVDQSQYLANFPDVLGADASWVVILEKLFEPFVPETGDHRLSILSCIDRKIL
jgi:hypothetical protein